MAHWFPQDLPLHVNPGCMGVATFGHLWAKLGRNDILPLGLPQGKQRWR